jgi:hypothetical protein
MRLIALAAVLATLSSCSSTNSDSCSAAIACASSFPGGGPDSYQLCSGGGGQYYGTSTGSRFPCAASGSCADALSSVESWCIQASPATGPAMPAVGPQSGETCLAAQECLVGGIGKSFQLCTSSDGAHCRILTNDGRSLSCACGSCLESDALDTWCGGGTTPCNGDGVGGSMCRDCCNARYNPGYQIASKPLLQCLCGQCGGGTCEFMTWCGGDATTSSAACDACMSANIDACVRMLQPTCSQDADCATWAGCVLACPN